MMCLYRHHTALISGSISFAVILAVWQLSVDVGLVNAFFVSTPSRVAVEIWRQLQTGELATNLYVSLYEFACGMALAIVVGVSLGVFASWSRTVQHVLDPFIWFKYSAPTIAFYPLFVAWLGLGAPTIIAISFLFAFTPIYVNTLAGIRDVDPDIMRAARSFGARRQDLFFKVQLPASVPIMIAGLRLGVGRALTGVVAAELFGATAGLGFSIAFYGQKLKTTEMMVSLVVVIVLGVILTQLLSAFEARFDTWRAGQGGEMN
jgi:NitT/TauT family transport system permease protein